MLKTFSITDIGRKRKMNQDYVYTSVNPIGNLPNLFIVADGMGGHNAGDYASKYTVETIVKEVENSFEVNPEKIIGKAVTKANSEILNLASQNEDLFGMGTTIVVATCMGKYLRVANVGDSRLYIVGEKIRQVTTDHSMVEEMVRMGSLDRQAARNHPKKNIITRAIGAAEDVKVDFFQEVVKPGEMILMCSDGLTNMLEDEEIRMILQGSKDIEEKAKALVEAANLNGGKDNIAVVLIEPFQE